MGFLGETAASFKSIPARQTFSQLITLGLIVTSALVIWKALMCITGSESPVVVVLSESMEPAFQRSKYKYSTSVTSWMPYGEKKTPYQFKAAAEKCNDGIKYEGDILFLSMSDEPIHAGEIVVFKVKGRLIPIVHRVIKVHQRRDGGKDYLVTKGDNNGEDDRVLYPPGQRWLQRNDIMGRAVGFLPYIGWVTIIMTEKPIIKYILIGALGMLVITSKS